MDLVCEERLSDSPFVESVWRSQSEKAAPFISMADNRNALVITQYKGKTVATVRGPETKATTATEQAETELLGIRFKPGVFMPYMPAKMVMDRRDFNLPEAGSNFFWLNGSAWQFPDYENADTFVDWLTSDGLLVYDPLVNALLHGRTVELSPRQVQRRFLQATGLSHKVMHQIQRARYATSLLKQGTPVLNAVHQAGYFDQSHLIRSLKRYIGLTPGQISDPNRNVRMSFLYNTAPLAPATMSLQEDDERDRDIRVLEAGWRPESGESPPGVSSG